MIRADGVVIAGGIFDDGVFSGDRIDDVDYTILGRFIDFRLERRFWRMGIFDGADRIGNHFWAKIAAASGDGVFTFGR